MHSLKKLLGLVVLYAIIIVGIFVIQFRSDSIIRKNIHGLRVTLAQTEENTNKTVLKNTFQASYKGITFSADEGLPVICSKNGESVPVKLLSFEETPLSIALNFEEEVKIIFALESAEDNSTLQIIAQMPEDAQSIAVNFSPNSGYSLTELKSRSAIFAGKSNEFSLNGAALSDRVLTLQKGSTPARYAMVVEKGQLSLDDIDSIALASPDLFNQNFKWLTESIMSEFINASENNANFAASLNEQTVISFLAAMANAGRYNEGINTIPESFVSGTRRTYLSAPFLGKMADTMPTLTMQVENFNNLIERAVQEQTLSVFTMNNIAQYMYTQGNKGNVARLVKMPASLTTFEPTILQAAGIIRAYIYFSQQKSSMAPPLEPVLELCAQKIMDSCLPEGEKIILAENETPLSVLDAVTAGDALITYGAQTEQERIQKFGCFIVNSYANSEQGLDLRTMAELYSILVHNNSYYPHFSLLRTLESGNVWAYTIARDIDYNRDENLTIKLDIEFPVGLSHFMFISNITPFRRIQIYNMDFRTDARFETYNSSGYVYRSAAQTLLLKSRHRDRKETIRLFYRDIVEETAEDAEEEPSEE